MQQEAEWLIRVINAMTAIHLLQTGAQRPVFEMNAVTG